MSTLPAVRDLEITSGDDFSLELYFDADGSPMDLTTGVVLSQIRLTADAAGYLAQFAVDMTDAATGTIIISLTEAETAALDLKRLANAVWDLQITLSGVTQTYIKGDAYLIGDVSR